MALAVCLAPGAAAASDRGRDDGYCDWLLGVADAEAALLTAPSIFGHGGLVNATSSETGNEASGQEVTTRVSVGLQYDFIDLWRGGLVRDRGEAECRLHVATRRLQAALDARPRIAAREPLEARMAILTDAIPTGAALISEIEADLTRQVTTVEELYAARLRQSALRDQLAAARAELDRLATHPAPPAGALRDLLAAHRAADEAVQAQQAALRTAQAWALEVRGGLDQVFGVSQELPAFALIQARFNFGRLFQGAAHDRARAGRARWLRGGFEELGRDAAQLLAELEAEVRGADGRLGELQAILGDVVRQHAEVTAVQGRETRRFASFLWYEGVRLQGELAALRARRDALAAFIEGAGDVAAEDAEAAPTRTDTTRAAREAEARQRVEEQVRAQLGRPTAPRTDRFRPLHRADLDVTSGALDGAGEGMLRVTGPRVRAVAERGRARAARLRFRWHGDSAEVTPLASGSTRSQVALKLRAKDGNNLVYVVWRVHPEQRIVVSVKHNPDRKGGKTVPRGYENIAPEEAADPPPVKTGEIHQLTAQLEGRRLTVTADDRVVWRGTLPPEVLTFDGPAGLRTDNGRFDLWLQAADGP